MRKLFFKRQTLWASDVEDLACEIKDLCGDTSYYKDIPVPSSEQLRVIQEVTDIKMGEFSIYKDAKESDSKIGYRLLSLIIAALMILCVPVLWVKWLLTGKYFIQSRGKVGLMIETIFKRGGF